jgi:hypothetical protein
VLSVNVARVLAPGRAYYAWGGYANCGNYPPVLKAMGLIFAQAIIWVKEHPVQTRKDYWVITNGASTADGRVVTLHLTKKSSVVPQATGVKGRLKTSQKAATARWSKS